MVVLLAGALTLAAVSVVVVAWTLVSHRIAARYRRRDALDIAHYLARRRARRSTRR